MDREKKAAVAIAIAKEKFISTYAPGSGNSVTPQAFHELNVHTVFWCAPSF
jgi:hypothetical protein